MRIHVICAALLAFCALPCATLMGQNNASNSEKKQAPQGPATTIPLSTGTPINASLVGTLDSEQEQTRRSGHRNRYRIRGLPAQRAATQR